MPLTHFQCPDGEKIELGACMVQCRMAERCVSKPTLMTLILGQRTWKGQPSTTQLLNGTRLEYLRIKNGYSTRPRDNAFSLLGSSHHALLEQNLEESEMQLGQKGSLVSGVADLLMPDDSTPGSHIILDYKTFGSFRVAKLLGLAYRDTYSETEVYKRSGNWGRAGSPKKIKEWYQDPSLVENFDESMQLNHYRILAQRRGYSISGMELQITVRDGGLQVARERGVTENIYYPVKIPYLPDADVEFYFQYKAEQLIQALASNTEPPECDNKESWEGLRCRRYCDVADICSRGQREKLLHGD
jgi:hypothetical protein